MKKTVAALCFLFVLGGCASSGNQSLKEHDEQTIGHYITEGQTTKAEVRSQFGSPINTTFTDNGLEIWEYSLSDMSADAVSYIPIVSMFGTSTSGTQKKLTVLFNEEDTVYRYSMTESDVKMGTGVFR
ncbi:hypothetical protein OR573_03225 [Halomonas sp. CH40]